MLLGSLIPEQNSCNEYLKRSAGSNTCCRALLVMTMVASTPSGVLNVLKLEAWDNEIAPKCGQESMQSSDELAYLSFSIDGV